MSKIGIIGLPNAGKSSLYNLLTGANALIGPYPNPSHAAGAKINSLLLQHVYKTIAHCWFVITATTGRIFG